MTQGNPRRRRAAHEAQRDAGKGEREGRREKDRGGGCRAAALPARPGPARPAHHTMVLSRTIFAPFLQSRLTALSTRSPLIGCAPPPNGRRPCWNARRAQHAGSCSSVPVGPSSASPPNASSAPEPCGDGGRRGAEGGTEPAAAAEAPRVESGDGAALRGQRWELHSAPPSVTPRWSAIIMITHRTTGGPGWTGP